MRLGVGGASRVSLNFLFWVLSFCRWGLSGPAVWFPRAFPQMSRRAWGASTGPAIVEHMNSFDIFCEITFVAFRAAVLGLAEAALAGQQIGKMEREPPGRCSLYIPQATHWPATGWLGAATKEGRDH